MSWILNSVSYLESENSYVAAHETYISIIIKYTIACLATRSVPDHIGLIYTIDSADWSMTPPTAKTFIVSIIQIAGCMASAYRCRSQIR